MPLKTILIKRLIRAGKSLYERGFLTASDGNLSVRLNPDEILITPSGICKGNLQFNDLILLNPAGEVISGSRLPSSETAMHLFIYQKRPDIHAIIHTHPPYATVLSVAGKTLETHILPEALLSLGTVPLIPYAATGIPEMALSLADHISHHDAFLHKNHGLTVLGEDLNEALMRTETAEHCARIYYLALQDGNCDLLPAEEIKRLEQIRKSMKAIK